MVNFVNRWGCIMRGLKNVKLGEIYYNVIILLKSTSNSVLKFIASFIVSFKFLNENFYKKIYTTEVGPLSLKLVFIGVRASLKYFKDFIVKQFVWFLRPYIYIYPVIPYRDELGDFTWGWFFTVVAAAGPCVLLALWWYTAILYTKRGPAWSFYKVRNKFLRFVIIITIIWGFWSALFYWWFFFIYDPATYYDIIRGYYRDGTEVVPGQWPKKRGW